jgi:hypothetical protein
VRCAGLARWAAQNGLGWRGLRGGGLGKERGKKEGALGRGMGREKLGQLRRLGKQSLFSIFFLFILFFIPDWI